MIENSAVETIVCETPEKTFAFGEKFGSNLKGGEIVLLKGELGAGKTLFVKGVMNGLDYDVDEVTSPTFTLVNVYETASLKVFHIDLYRLNTGFSAAYAVDLDEILQDERAVVLIEWAERLADFPLPANAVLIEITGDGDAPRLVKISGFKSPLN
ncbi:MAG: tRNA (adenosine(37)-N6)-threonylcarbamoyltransferase complex ATPase subunit type 1 TsaE [Pyrinomonadaceae bacterium]|nr:tRNA (adenosine(37)-N6)-threonylcarbamoyltransferase complex ATPase subunit type 1 TsaE [Pyrinomonadaceae bacterium]